MLQNVDTMIGFAVVMLILSLIITVLVQAVVAVFELRGKNLIASLTKLLLQMEPELRKTDGGIATAREISTAVATHPSLVHFSELAQGKVGRLIARYFTRPAKGIEASEWISVLDDLATNPQASLSPEARTLLTKLQSTYVAVQSPESARELEQVVEQWERVSPNQTNLIKDAIQGAGQRTRQIVVGTEKWFDAVMDRSSDWFTTQTRSWTIILALALAVVFRIDSFQIIRQLADNPEVRAKLVQQADQALYEARSVPARLSPEAAVSQLKGLKSQLDEPQLNIITSPLDSRNAPTVPPWFSVGTLVTGLLLTLGAPFWFNALSQLAHLRPGIADKLDKSDTRQNLETVASFTPPIPKAKAKAA